MAFRNVASNITVEFKLEKAAMTHRRDKRRSRLAIAALPPVWTSVFHPLTLLLFP